MRDVHEALGRDEELEAPVVALEEPRDAEDEREVAEELGGGEEVLQARRSLIGVGARPQGAQRACGRPAPTRGASPALGYFAGRGEGGEGTFEPWQSSQSCWAWMP